MDPFIRLGFFRNAWHVARFHLIRTHSHNLAKSQKKINHKFNDYRLSSA